MNFKIFLGFILFSYLVASCVNNTSSIKDNGQNQDKEKSLRNRFFNSIKDTLSVDLSQLDRLVIFHLNSTGCGSCDEKLKSLVDFEYGCTKILILRDSDTLNPFYFEVDHVYRIGGKILDKYGIGYYYGFSWIIKDEKEVQFIPLDKDSTISIKEQIGEALLP